MTLKRHITTASLIAMLGLATPIFAQTATDTDGDGQNDLADKTPVLAENTIPTSGAPAPLQIAEALAENNYDLVAKAAAPDHLELLVKNTGAADVTGFSLYYQITDNDSGVVEGYLRRLDGFVMPANGEARINVDDSGLPGHFRANPNGIYVTSQAAKTFAVTLAADGFAPVTVEIAKDAGGAEAAD